MATVCPSCGAENGPQDRYCHSCGVELGRATTPDTHPDEAVDERSRTERDQALDDDEGEDSPVAYSSETDEDDGG